MVKALYDLKIKNSYKKNLIYIIMGAKDLSNFSKLLFCNQGGNMELLYNHPISVISSSNTHEKVVIREPTPSNINIQRAPEITTLSNLSTTSMRRSSSWYLNMLNWHFK
jgi:hypothetical protein